MKSSYFVVLALCVAVAKCQLGEELTLPEVDLPNLDVEDVQDIEVYSLGSNRKLLGPDLTTQSVISEEGYPMETHTVTTPEGYILNMFRIPYSPKTQNQNVTDKPVIYMQHGFGTSSVGFVLNHEHSLAFMAADLGYDVWLGNNRGCQYSKKHKRWSSWNPLYWAFSWDAIAVDDIPTMVDYILKATKQKKLHAVGHSQGTTVLAAMLADRPEYNDKIATVHLLAPCVFMKNIKSPIAKILAPALGHTQTLDALVGNGQFGPSPNLIQRLGAGRCEEQTITYSICQNILFLLFGHNSFNISPEMVPRIVATHPDTSSAKQLIHFIQEYVSGRFTHYDFGFAINLMKYKSKSPPDYNLGNITTRVVLYYGDNDNLSHPTDVEHLAMLLPNVELNHVPEYNHLDFMWATSTHQLINEPLLKRIGDYEQSLQKIE